MSAMVRVVVRPDDVEGVPLGGKSAAGAVNITAEYDRTVELADGTIRYAGVRTPLHKSTVLDYWQIDVIASDAADIVRGAGCCVTFRVEVTPRHGGGQGRGHGQAVTTHTKTIQVVTSDGTVTNLATKASVVPVPEGAVLLDPAAVTKAGEAYDLAQDAAASAASAQASATNSAAAAAASAALVGAPADNAIAAAIDGPGTLTREAGNKQWVSVNELAQSASRWLTVNGSTGYVTSSSWTTFCNALLSSGLGAKNPARIYVDGDFLIPTHLPAGLQYVTFFGDAMGYNAVGRNRIRTDAGNSILAPSATVYGIGFENLCLQATAGSGHLIDFDKNGTSGSPGGLVFARFDNVFADVREPSARFISGGQSVATQVNDFFDVRFDGCRIERQSTATVEAIKVISMSDGLNHVTFNGGWWHSHGCSSAPFARFEGWHPTQPSGDLTLNGVIGEQNVGGMLHVGSLSGVTIEHTKDWDSSDTYTDDLFKIYRANGTTGAVPAGVHVRESGTASTVAFAAGKYHLNAAAATSVDISRVINGQQPGYINAPPSGKQWEHGGGIARSLRYTGASTSATRADDVILCGGSSAMTITLPNPTVAMDGGTFPIGRQYTVRNSSSATVTVVTGGGHQVNGAASATLAAGTAGTYITDGADWFQV